MSDTEFDNLPDMYEEDEVVQETKPKKKFTEKQLETVRNNLAKGRAMRLQQINAQKQAASKVKQYKVTKKGKLKEPEESYSDESDYSSEDEPEYEIRPKKGKAKPTKKSAKETQRLDKIEQILEGLAKAQKKAKRPQHNTIVQIPQIGSSRPVSNVQTKAATLLRLFN